MAITSFDDSLVIDAFVRHLRANGHPNLQVNRRPDQENLGREEIDAVAGCFAIEHTSIDTLPDQRRNSAWFRSVFGALQDQFAGQVPFRLRIIFPYDAIQKGQNWASIRDSIRDWVSNSSFQLPDGIHTVLEQPGIPFEFQAEKLSRRRPGVFLRRSPPGEDLLPERLYAQINRKARKLAPYRDSGYTTVLLLESNDLVLMNADKALEAVREALCDNLPQGVDEIWYAETDTSDPDEIYFHDFTTYLA